jgi:hypothetical protein
MMLVVDDPGLEGIDVDVRSFLLCKCESKIHLFDGRTLSSWVVGEVKGIRHLKMRDGMESKRCIRTVGSECGIYFY